MRVLHVSPYFPPALPYGGPPASVLGLCQGLQRAGVDVEVVTTTANGSDSLPASPAGGDVYEGVPVRYAERSFPRRFFGARVRPPLTEALSRADVCHVHGVWNVPEWWASHLAHAAGVPYVISPRGMLHVYRFADLLPELGSGRLWSKNPDFDPGGNTQLRVAELEAIAHAAASETVPLVIAGDSNSPGLSPALRRALSGYLDGFSAVGSGLGYTYPAKRPFLRLDRIFVGQSLGFASFHVGCAGASDHLCVWADIVRR